MKATTRQAEQSTHRRKWLAHVNAQMKSGLSRMEYCKQYDLSYHTMTYWAGKKKSSRSKSKTALVPVPLKRDMLPYSSQAETVALRVNLSAKISIDVGDNLVLSQSYQTA